MAKHSTINYEALKAHQNEDPFIKELFLKTKAVYTAYHDLLGDLVSTKATKKGTVLSFYNYLKTLRSKLKEWDLEVQRVLKEGTPEYVAIFPNGKSFILQGTQEQIMAKFSGFYTNVLLNSGLAAITDDVSLHYQSLQTIYGSKNEKLSKTNTSTTDLDKAYDQMGKTLYCNMLMLIVHFVDNPVNVENYFDMTLLRTPQKHSKKDNAYKLPLPANSIRIADIGFSIGDTLLIINNGTNSISFYAAATADAATPAILNEIAPGEELEITAASLGAPNNKFLIFVNTSLTDEGEVEIVLI